MVKYGEYMANASACMDCHTPMEKGQFVMSKMMAGGRPFDLGIFTVTSANITQDSATGIGKWSETMFLDKFKNYRDFGKLSEGYIALQDHGDKVEFRNIRIKVLP